MKKKGMIMKSIESIDLSKLRVQEDFGFQKQILAEAEKLTAETDKQMVATYKAAVEAFDEALKAAQGSALTASLTAADQKADEAWSGLYATVKAQLNNPTDSVRTAAETVWAALKKYGNVTSLPYNEEYGKLHNLLQDLTTIGTETLTKCFADGWATALQTRYDEFVSIREQRTAEEGTKEVGIVKTTRTACDEAYKTLASCVNALVILQGETNYATFIDNVNVIIDSAKATLSARKTRNAAKRKAASSDTSTSTEEKSDASSTPTFTDDEESADSGR